MDASSGLEGKIKLRNLIIIKVCKLILKVICGIWRIGLVFHGYKMKST